MKLQCIFIEGLGSRWPREDRNEEALPALKCQLEEKVKERESKGSDVLMHSG